MPDLPRLIVASRNNLVLVGTFITLLQAVAFSSQDRDALKKLWERFKWKLRIYSRGNELFEGALRRVDDKRTWVEIVLEKGFTPISPIKQNREEGLQRHPLGGFAMSGGEISGFPELPMQSMEELLKTDGFAARNLPNTHEFTDQFIGFEEFSGWDGFDINNM